MCAVTPATVPGLERRRPPWTSSVNATSAQTLDFMKGNVCGALSHNFDSAFSVKELTATVESLLKPITMQYVQDYSARCRGGRVLVEREIG